MKAIIWKRREKSFIFTNAVRSQQRNYAGQLEGVGRAGWSCLLVRERLDFVNLTTKFLHRKGLEQQWRESQSYREHILEASLHEQCHQQTDKTIYFIHINGTLFQRHKIQGFFFLTLYQLFQLSVMPLFNFFSHKLSGGTILLRILKTYFDNFFFFITF